MRARATHLLWALPVTILLAAGCASEGPEVAVYQHAITARDCTPDPATFMPLPQTADSKLSSGKGGHNSPTGIPGDNLDDLHSGKIDCYYDGNSGAGNDRKGCMPQDFPRPGCDRGACCDIDILVEPRDPGSITLPDDDDEVPVTTIDPSSIEQTPIP